MTDLHRTDVRILLAAMTAISLASVPAGARAGDEAWKTRTIADALMAAPPSVTDDATILGWSDTGELTFARYGSGPYTCIASGAFSVRLGQPPLPYPDPMCLDRNAWAFLQAIWAGKAASEAGQVPAAPGLVWMLAGMNVSKTAVDVGAAAITVSQDTGEQTETETVQMSPHVMIMPLPSNEGTSGMTTSYSLEDPFRPWIMASGKPHEHLMVHFTEQDTNAMMKAGD